MIHLRRVVVRAYRSIVKADLRLGEITVVIGPSDSGKSNLVRALRDWAYNASGTRFVTSGHSITRVGVAVGAAHKVVFEKQVKSKHASTRFFVQDADEGGLVAFEKVGLTVPAEVESVTGIREVVVDDLRMRINFSGQAEPWFLLAPRVWTPAKVSRVIGRVSGVDALLLANRDLVCRRTAFNREAKTCRKAIAAAEESLSRFDRLEELADKTREAKKAHEDLVALRASLESATELVEEVSSKRKRTAKTKALAKALASAVKAADRSDLNEDDDRLKRATQVSTRILSLRTRLAESTATTVETESALSDLLTRLADMARDEDLICPLCGGDAHQECRDRLATEAGG